jgi:hypothetical protein
MTQGFALDSLENPDALSSKAIGGYVFGCGGINKGNQVEGTLRWLPPDLQNIKNQYLEYKKLLGIVKPFTGFIVQGLVVGYASGERTPFAIFFSTAFKLSLLDLPIGLQQQLFHPGLIFR